MHFIASSVIVLTSVHLIAALEAPQITAAAVLERRQNSDPSLVGWVSTSGASQFSVERSCDYPATLSKSGSYAQCCASTGSCEFWTACNNGVLQAASTSEPCYNGICNTGVIIASLGANGGQSFLGCWPTDYGSAAFSLVQNIGTAMVATSTMSGGTGSSSEGSAAATTSMSSSGQIGMSSAQTSSGGSSTSSSATSTSSHNAAATGSSFSGLFGAVAVAIAML